MREAIGGTWLFGLVITFIVFFASFLAISINYAKAFDVKNQVVDLISKYEGNNSNARNHIGTYLRNRSALVLGECPSDYTGYDLNGNIVFSPNKSYYCVDNTATDDSVTLEKKFYRVIVFFKIDLPIVGSLTTFKIKGETESIFYPREN